MTTIRLVGNTFTSNSTANVVPIANTYGANATSGATCMYISNPVGNNVVITIANTLGSFTFTMPANADPIILQKVSTDTISTALANGTSAGLTINPVAKVPA